MKKLISAAVLAALATATIAAPIEAQARHHYRYGHRYNNDYNNGYNNGYDSRYDSRYNNDGYNARYDSRYYAQDGSYRDPRPLTRNDQVWRGNDGRYYCKRDNGTTGLIIGAGAGALLGNVVDGGRHRALGTILGALGGGVAGREIDRSDNHGLTCR